MQKRKSLPKLGYGQGSLSWDSKTEGLIVYRKTIKIADGLSQRESVTGFSPEECFKNMEQRELDLKELYKKTISAREEYKNLTVQDGIRQWLKENKYGKIKDRSYDRLEQTLNNQIVSSEIGTMLTYNVDSENAKKFFKELESKYSISTQIKTYDLLNAYMRFAYKKRNQEGNPMCDIERPVKRANSVQIDLNNQVDVSDITCSDIHVVKPEEILSDNEIDIFKHEISQPYLPGISGYRYGHGLCFIMFTFLRVGEALALRWSDVDIKNRTVFVNKAISTIKNRDNENTGNKYKRVIGTTKYDSERTIVLTDEAIHELELHKEIMKPQNSNDFIFLSSNGTITHYRVLYESLCTIMKNTKLKKERFSPHTLRHTGISYYIRHGVPIDVIANMAGHSVEITRKVYYHIIKDQQKNALDIMNQIKR